MKWWSIKHMIPREIRMTDDLDDGRWECWQLVPFLQLGFPIYGFGHGTSTELQFGRWFSLLPLPFHDSNPLFLLPYDTWVSLSFWYWQTSMYVPRTCVLRCNPWISLYPGFWHTQLQMVAWWWRVACRISLQFAFLVLWSWGVFDNFVLPIARLQL